FGRCAVSTRSLGVLPNGHGNTLQGRTAQAEDQLLEYAIAAVERLAVDPAEIGTVVTSSLYSLGGPTLAHRLVEHFRMDPATDKYHVTGVGCASGVPLMRLASQALRSHPARDAVVVAAESMSAILTRATPADPRAKTVGSALFG